MYVPVASVPAENTAVSPLVQAAVATSPFASVLQKLLEPQVPVGVTPAPVVAPLESQYKSATATVLNVKAIPNANSAFFMRSHLEWL